MFSLKADKAANNSLLDIKTANLSAYDLSVAIMYSDPIDRSDVVMMRYEGSDGESLLEISLLNGLICEIGLRCFSGSVTIYKDSPWTRPESSDSQNMKYSLVMDDNECEVRLGLRRIDQRLDFEFLIFYDAVVFITSNEEVIGSIKLGEDLFILLGESKIVVGYVLISQEHAARLCDTYC